MTLATLLAGEGVGARLATMLATGPLGSMSLREFTLDREQAVEWLLRQPNCGTKTVHELVTLIDGRPRPPVRPRLPSPEPPLADVTLIDLLAADTPSARLADVLRDTALGTTTLLDFLRSRKRIEREMLRIPNCGQRSVNELRGLVGMHVRQQSEAQALDQAAYGAEFKAIVEAATMKASEVETPPPGEDLRTLVAWHLSRLPRRTADMILQRFGLAGAPPRTLADIGADYDITRERVRQIEAKGIKTMLTACRRFPIKPLVDAVSDDLLDTIFGSARHVGTAAADRLISSFDGWTELALLLAHGGTAAWFRKHAKKLGSGWLAPGADPAGVKATAAELRRRVRKRPFPRLAEELLDGLDGPLALAAMELLTDWKLEFGYVFARRPGPRLRRTALLHAVLAREPLPMEMAPLLRRYRAAIPTDQCTDRDLVIVMEAATHLFIEIHEGCWTALGQAAPIEPSDRIVDAELEHSSILREGDEGTNAAALERELERVGPTRLGVLMGRAIDILPEGRSRHSVGPTLLLNPTRFVRVLPGVYALPDQVLDGRRLVEAGAVGYLLNASQARFYAVGRKAGEPWGAFPMWTPTAEMRLCRWARAGGDRDVYRSLLDVASIDDWPTDEPDKEVWRDLQSREARFELWSEPRLSGNRPPVDRVLAAAIRLERSGTIGWVAANRILGYVPSSYAGGGLLAGMVRAGMATQRDGDHGWQLPHGRGPRLSDWVKRMAHTLHEAGTIEWTSGVGSELALVFSNQGDDADLPADEPEETDEYERVMAEHRRSMQARRIEARLELEAE